MDPNVGPIDQTGPDPSPFSSFDNRIKYNEMMRYQMISQYNQLNPTPTAMSSGMQFNVATNPRYQYGTLGGQDLTTYMRQSAMNRIAYGGTAAGAMTTLGLYEAAGIAGTAMGLTGAAGLLTPMIAPMVPGYFLTKGIQNTMERQRYMHQIANDVYQYRNQLGLNGVSYNALTAVGRGIAGGMLRGTESEEELVQRQFFNPEQQMRIHKIGLAEGLISARSGPGSVASLDQYKRNVNEFTKTIKELTIMMNTTIEGAASVVKELKNMGFTSNTQIRQQAVQATAYGNLTGLGTQNMMLIGSAGARAVQNTPYSATTGFNMYQSAATQVTTLAQNNLGMAMAVRGVGGPAAAASTIGNMNFNLLSSGMGTSALAYAMNTNGTLNQERLNKLISGKVSAYEMVTGAGERGYGMGPGGRAMFERYRGAAVDAMGPYMQTAATMGIYNAWSQKFRAYGAKPEETAWVFAKQMNEQGDPRSRELIYQWLMAPKNMDVMAANEAVAKMSANAINSPRTKDIFWEMGAAPRALVRAGMGIGEFGIDLTNTISRTIGSAGRFAAWAGGSLAERALYGLTGGQYGTQYGVFNRSKLGDITQAGRQYYGLDYNTLSQTALNAQASISRSPGVRARGGFLGGSNEVNLGLDFASIFKNSSVEQLRFAEQQLFSAGQLGNPETAFRDPKIRRILNMTIGSSALGMAMENPYAAQRYISTGWNNYKKSMNKEADDALDTAQKAIKIYSLDPAKNKLIQDARRTIATEEWAQKEWTGNLNIPTSGMQMPLNSNSFIRQSTGVEQRIKNLVGQEYQAMNNKNKVGALGNDIVGSTNIDRLSRNNINQELWHGLSRVTGVDYRTVSGNNIVNWGRMTDIKWGLSPNSEITRRLTVGFGAKDLTEVAALSKESYERVGKGYNITDYKDKDVMQATIDKDKERLNLLKKYKLYNPEGDNTPLEKWMGLGVVGEGMTVNGQITGAAHRQIDLATRVLSTDKKPFVVSAQEQAAYTNFLLTGQGKLSSTGMAIAHAATLNPLSQLQGMQAGDLRNMLLSTKSQGDTPAADQSVRQLLDDAKQINTDIARGVEKIKVFTGEPDKKTGERQSDTVDWQRAKAMADAKTALAQQYMEKTGERDTSQGRSVDSVMAPPLMNYWNNRWAL